MKDASFTFNLAASYGNVDGISDPTWETKLNGTVMLNHAMRHQSGKATGSADLHTPKDYYYPSIDDMLRWQREYGVDMSSVAPRIKVY